MPSSTGQSGQPKLDPGSWLDDHGDTLLRYALSRLRDVDAAEEAVQETFVAALRARDQYAGTGSVGAWLMGICKRKVIDIIRRRNKPDTAVGGDIGPDPSDNLFDQRGHWKSDPRIFHGRPERMLESEEFWAAFRGCLQDLPARQAAAFTLRELDEMGSDEICRELEISSTNLWVLLHRARLRLTQCMKSHLER